MRRHVLLIEEHPADRASMSAALRGIGFRVTEVGSAQDAIRHVAGEPVDVVCLELVLPDADGVDLCREIRQASPVPIVVVSERKDSHDVVAALAAGADDYVRKPVELPELRARIRAVLRRGTRNAGEPSTLTVGGLEIRTKQGKVLRDGRSLTLTHIEYRLLCELAAHSGQPVGRDHLLQQVWGDGYDDERLVDVHISRLRRKVEKDPQCPTVIQTARGIGYRMPG